MTHDIAIKVANLTKVYQLYDKPQDRFKEALNPFKKSYHHEFYAVNDISFEIKRGETVGIIGKNGAGKSTLLKMITGVLTPTSGSIQVNGKIASLLELGAGFNPEMTGLENIYLNGTLMGFSHQEMEPKIEAILEFADIGEFISQPVKVYSSGMFARLAFSVAINVEPDVLIIDEALSVGDVRFQQKCYRKFREFQENKKTILFVTHDVSAIINYCSYVIWLHEGGRQADGLPERICKEYTAEMTYESVSVKTNSPAVEKNIKGTRENVDWINIEEIDSFGERGAVITAIALSDERGLYNNIFEGGEKVALKLKIHAYEKISDLIMGFIAYDNLGNPIFGSNTYIEKYRSIGFERNQEYIVDFNFTMPCLRNGDFSISPAIAEGTQNEHIQHHWVHSALCFKINTLNDSAKMGWMLSINDIKIEVK